jgi:carbon starvation protein CstA
MLASILIALTPFILNGLTQVTKVLTDASSTAWVRVILTIFAVIGVICGNALTGSPIDVPTVTGFIQVALVSGAAFLSAHGSYHLLFKGDGTSIASLS